MPRASLRLRFPLVLSVLLLFAATGCGTTQPAAPPLDAGMLLPGDYAYPADDTVRVVTWNVEHFVDAYDDPYVQNDREDSGAAMEGRLALFADAVRALDADVLVLQEFESLPFLAALADSLFPDLGYRFFSGTESLTWYQNVVVASRLPLGVVRAYNTVWTPIEGETDDEGRPASQSLVNHRVWMLDVLARPDYTLALVGAHLKAGRGPRNEGWRRGQIRFLHAELDRLRALRPDANVLIAGDLNALADSEELQLLLNADGTAGPARFSNPIDGQWTHPSDDPQRQLDYLLPSATMQPELVPGSMAVAGPLPPAQMAALSDHLPVVATFIASDRD